MKNFQPWIDYKQKIKLQAKEGTHKLKPIDKKTISSNPKSIVKIKRYQ